MSLNPKHINRELDRYFNGEMTGSEMHQIEKLALSDSFLKDAMDGYAENAGALNYYNQNIAQGSKTKFKFWVVSSLAVALLIMTGLYLTKNTVKINESQAITGTDLKPFNNNSDFDSEIEMMPAAIETLKTISTIEQIHTKSVKKDFTDNETYYAEAEEKNENIVLIDPNDLLMDEELPQIITAKKEQRKIIYPYQYFYDMAVVDYGRFENREKLINKTVYSFSGIDASFESENAKNKQEFIESTVIVRYIDYLEETMYYFSKDRYKNALKRFNIISTQYKYDLNAMFYGGLCYYNLGDFTTALKEFNAILKLKEGPFTEEASWYKAKTLIKLQKQAEAKEALATIIMNNGFYTSQASVLLKSLK